MRIFMAERKTRGHESSAYSDAISNMSRVCIELESFNDRNSYMRCQCEWRKAALAIYTWRIEYAARTTRMRTDDDVARCPGTRRAAAGGSEVGSRQRSSRGRVSGRRLLMRPIDRIRC